MADELEVSRSFYGRLETGERNTTNATTIARLAAILNVSARQITRPLIGSATTTTPRRNTQVGSPSATQVLKKLLSDLDRHRALGAWGVPGGAQGHGATELSLLLQIERVIRQQIQ